MTAVFLRIVVLALLLLAGPTTAHEIRPAYLQIDETAPSAYNVLWKVPSNGDRVLDIQPQFYGRLTLINSGQETLLDGFVVYHFRLAGPGGLPGTAVTIRNLENTTVDVLANVTLLGGSKHSFLLHPRSNSAIVPSTPSRWRVVNTYTALGVEHILLGIDHLLFVAALLFIVRGWRMLAKTITAFTVAHSITLALATLNLVRLPPKPVEVLIAASIMLVAVEAARRKRGGTGLAIRWPWLVAFVFGLLHGFGFAGALMEIGLPDGDVALALFFFNVGVELGQLVFIGMVFATLYLLRRIMRLPSRAPVAASYLIGTLAAFWMFERFDAMFI